MNVGEKIQFYRKNMNMSQEELAQKLLVSRQTISLWETGQTMPTIDNLLRLKEIFDVSVDELLDSAVPVKQANESALESYIFSYSDADVREMHKLIYLPRSVKLIYASFVLLVPLLILCARPVQLIFVLFLLYGFVIFSAAKNISRAKKKFAENLKDKKYEYSIYQDSFAVTIYKNSEEIKRIKIYFSQISRFWQNENLYIMEDSGLVYIIKRKELQSSSRLDKLFSEDISNQNEKSTAINSERAKYKIIRISGIIFSVLSLWLALFVIVVLSTADYIIDYMWVMYLFLPIPFISIVIGKKLISKGLKGKANVVVGTIMSILLFIYGSFSWMIPLNHSDEHFLSVEERLDIDFPEPKYITMTDYSDDNIAQNYGELYIYYTSSVYFSDDNALEFEKDLIDNSRWISVIPNDFTGLIPINVNITIDNCDYFLLFCLDSGEYNTIPENSGTYEYICITYDTEKNNLEISEYKIAYVK